MIESRQLLIISVILFFYIKCDLRLPYHIISVPT